MHFCTLIIRLQALGDRLFVANVGKLAQIHAAKSGQPTYVYRYAYRGSFSLSDVISQSKVNYGKFLLLKSVKYAIMNMAYRIKEEYNFWN